MALPLFPPRGNSWVWVETRVERGHKYYFLCCDIMAYEQYLASLLSKPILRRHGTDLDFLEGEFDRAQWQFLISLYLGGALGLQGRQVDIQEAPCYDDDPRHYGVGL